MPANMLAIALREESFMSVSLLPDANFGVPPDSEASHTDAPKRLDRPYANESSGRIRSLGGGERSYSGRQQR
jgi:hypothetical protein